jgi:hypothetical protein
VRALLGDEDSEEDDDAGAGHDAARGGAAPVPGVKRERSSGGGGGARVKREPGLGGGSVYLDLTRAPDAPLVVEGKEVGADEVAVCDLLDSDGEEGAGRWEVRKRPAVEVDDAAA